MKYFFSSILAGSAVIVFVASNTNNEMKETGLKTTRNNTILRCDSLYVAEGWIERFKNAKSQYTELLDTFKSINAVVKIENSTLILDKDNSIIVRVCVKLVKGPKN
jgi:hypothetical protein